MQEIHDLSMTSGGGGGGIVSGGGGGATGRFYGGGIGDRRMRAHQTILNHHQSLKCPRCNSLNTKFCYYNNYNLSQPRHFCKNCRRYWTKGGVLRNVPVGGGCRKAKRSKSKQLSVDKSRDGEEKEEEEEEEDKDRKCSSHSSSESSSLTAVNSTVAAAASVSAEGFLNLPGNGIEWSTLLSSNGGGFTEEIIGFNETTPFGLGGNSVNDQYRGETTSLVDNSEQNAVGFEPLDWGSNGGDQTLFDLTSTVDHTYWSQSQWTTSDQDDQIGLYLP